jgi:hypothetical protein
LMFFGNTCLYQHHSCYNFFKIDLAKKFIFTC